MPGTYTSGNSEAKSESGVSDHVCTRRGLRWQSPLPEGWGAQRERERVASVQGLAAWGTGKGTLGVPRWLRYSTVEIFLSVSFWAFRCSVSSSGFPYCFFFALQDILPSPPPTPTPAPISLPCLISLLRGLCSAGSLWDLIKGTSEVFLSHPPEGGSTQNSFRASGLCWASCPRSQVKVLSQSWSEFALRGGWGDAGQVLRGVGIRENAGLDCLWPAAASAGLSSWRINTPQLASSWVGSTCWAGRPKGQNGRNKKDLTN